MSVKMRMSEYERQMKAAEQIMKEDREILRALAGRPGDAAADSHHKAADPVRLAEGKLSTLRRFGRDDD
jgi:hypothetical protein